MTDGIITSPVVVVFPDIGIQMITFFTLGCGDPGLFSWATANNLHANAKHQLPVIQK
jgi:hypothetical protein